MYRNLRAPFPGHHHDPHVLLVCFPNRCPHLGYEWIRPKVIEQESYDTPFYNKFRRIIDWCLAHRKTVIAGSLTCLLGSIGLLSLVKQEFFPESVRPEVITELHLPKAPASRKVTVQ